MSTWWLWPTSLRINTLAWQLGFARLANCGHFSYLLFGLCALRFTFQCVVGSFSKDARFLQMWAQILVPVILLSFPFPFFGLLSDSKVEPLFGGMILRIIKVFNPQQACVWLRSLVAQAVQLLCLLGWSGWRKKSNCCFWMPLPCCSLSWRCFCIWKWAWRDW